MKPSILIQLTTLCLGANLVWAGAGEKLLPPSFLAGYQYVIRSQQTLETALGAGLPTAGKQVVDVTLELVASCRASPSSPGHRDISIQLSKVGMNAQMGGLRMTYDSSLPDSGATLLGQTFKSVVGKSFQISLDEQERVVDVKGQAEFEAQKSQLGVQVGVAQLIQSAMPMLTLGIPKEGAAPGQAWDHVKDSSMGPVGKLKAAYHVTYTGDENGKALFEYRGKLNLGAAAVPENGSKPRIGIEDGVLDGTMRVDKSKGFPAGGSGRGNLTMVVPNPANATQTLKLLVTQRRSFELLSMSRLE